MHAGSTLILIDGEPVDCLLDTGCKITLISNRLVTELPKKAISSLIRAANGTDIEVLGEVELPVRIGNRDVLVRVIASDHVAEMLLGIDWLEGHGAVWDLRQGEIHIQGSVFPLKVDPLVPDEAKKELREVLLRCFRKEMMIWDVPRPSSIG